MKDSIRGRYRQAKGGYHPRLDIVERCFRARVKDDRSVFITDSYYEKVYTNVSNPVLLSSPAWPHPASMKLGLACIRGGLKN